MVDDASRAAAAAILGDLAAEMTGQTAEQAAAGFVQDLAAGHVPVKADSVADRYRAVDDDSALLRLAVESAPWRARTAEQRERSLRPWLSQPAPQEQEQPVKPASAADWVTGLSETQFERLSEAVYQRQARSFEAEQAAAEPLESVLDGRFDEQDLELARQEAAVEAYADGYNAAQLELAREGEQQ